jgi:hypothetical protein
MDGWFEWRGGKTLKKNENSPNKTMKKIIK